MEEEKAISQANLAKLERLWRTVDQSPVDGEAALAGLMQLQLDQETGQNKLNLEVERLLNQWLMDTLKVSIDMDDPNWQEQCCLGGQRIVRLKRTIQLVFKAEKNNAIKRTTIINFIENVLQCLGVSDLTHILSLISEQICTYEVLEEGDQVKLLRIINLLLKRISKTEDYDIRGQLHFTLTRFLPINHDSGFHNRSNPAHASDWDKAAPTEEDRDRMSQDHSEVTFQFYEEFWEMQRYFVEVGELVAQKEDKTIPVDQLLVKRLRQIELTLKEMYQFFQRHKPQSVSEYYSQPLKFLKNYKLLPLQLRDPYFRRLIATQSMFFVFSLRHQPKNSPVVLSQTDGRTLAQIERMAKEYMESHCGEDGKELYRELELLFNNEVFWIDLKENWKEHKKNFIRQKDPEEEKAKAAARVGDIEKRRKELQKQVADKLKITGNKLLEFLKHREQVKVPTESTSTSFSYFYSQALSCLESFDKTEGRQTEFESRSDYNMFQWKAMRSLYRESIREVWGSGERGHEQMKEYRLINLMYKKQQEGERAQAQVEQAKEEGEPRKVVKTD